MEDLDKKKKKLAFLFLTTFVKHCMLSKFRPAAAAVVVTPPILKRKLYLS